MMIVPGERIKAVTADGLTYLNDDSEEIFIDFALCFQNWIKRHTTPEALRGFKEANRSTDEQVQEWVTRVNHEIVVGGRDIGGYPEGKLPCIDFYTEPLTHFEFADVQDFYRINYLVRKVGWRTQDLA